MAAPGSSTRDRQRWHSTAFRFRPWAHTSSAEPGAAAAAAGGEAGGADAGSISAQAAAIAAQARCVRPPPEGRGQGCDVRRRGGARRGGGFRDRPRGRRPQGPGSRCR